MAIKVLGQENSVSVANTGEDPSNLQLANCASGNIVGDCVYVAADQTSGRLNVQKADITDGNKMPSVGIITSKETDTACTVRVGGIAEDIYSGMESGVPYYVGNDGRPTDVSPAEPGSGEIHVQPIGTTLSSDIIRINPSGVLCVLTAN